MNNTPAELLKSYVNSQNFTSTPEVVKAMKDMFRDVIQNNPSDPTLLSYSDVLQYSP